MVMCLGPLMDPWRWILFVDARVFASSGEAAHDFLRWSSHAYSYIPRYKWWTHLCGSMLLTTTNLLLMRFLDGKEIPASTSYMSPSLTSVVPTMWVQPPLLMCGPVESSRRLPSFMGGPPPVCWPPATMVPHSSCPTQYLRGLDTAWSSSFTQHFKSQRCSPLFHAHPSFTYDGVLWVQAHVDNILEREEYRNNSIVDYFVGSCPPFLIRARFISWKLPNSLEVLLHWCLIFLYFALEIEKILQRCLILVHDIFRTSSLLSDLGTVNFSRRRLIFLLFQSV